MPKTNFKLKFILPAIFICAFFALAGNAEAAANIVYVDKDCVNNITIYNPETGACTGGSSRVYDSLPHAEAGLPDGTAANPNIVNIRGGTYVLTSKLVLNSPYTTWRRTPGDAKPIITDNSALNTNRQGLVQIQQDHIILDGLEFYNIGKNDGSDWSGDAIQISPPTDTAGQAGYSEPITGIVIRNCYIHDIGRMAFLISGSFGAGGRTGSGSWCTVDDITIENNEIYQVEQGHAIGPRRGTMQWAAALLLRFGISNVAIKNNTWKKVHGEVLNLSRSSTNILVEHNIIIDHMSAAVFVSGVFNTIVRYNLIYRSTDSLYYGGGGGIAVECERWGGNAEWVSGVNNVDIYGNLIANEWGGIAIGNFNEGDEFGVTYTLSNCRIYNNTVIVTKAKPGTDNGRCLYIGGTAEKYSTGNLIKNNMFFSSLTTEQSRIAHNAWGLTRSDFDIDYNLWTREPEKSYFRGEHDPAYVPWSSAGAYLAKASWESLLFESLTGQEFALRSTATNARGKGANLGAPYNHLLNLAASNFKTNTFNFKDQPASGAWDIGAGVYVGGDTQAPDSPSGLSVR